MKRIGLIGGVSPESTVIYYELLNKMARQEFGGQTSFKAQIFALDYGEMIGHYQAEDWPAFIRQVVRAGSVLKAGGADALAICSNTTHLASDDLARETGLPVIHMLDALATEMDRVGARAPLLLGTPVVMAGPFYRPALANRYEGEIHVPDEWAQNAIARIILNELVNGRVEDRSRDELISIIDRACAYGADSVILGCTELCMILSQGHIEIPLFDTTFIHARAIAAFAFEKAS
ncbi:MAG: amino acid racemase [Pseudomonadota bacterium]